MTTLEGVLAQVRERVDRYTGAPINEQETKAALIEPILRALGWDVEDIEEVRREYKPKRADNPVD
jgi:predicted type IV restriction endonuclease